MRWECRRGGGGAASAGGWGWRDSSVRSSKRDLPVMMVHKDPAAIGVLRKRNTFLTRVPWYSETLSYSADYYRLLWYTIYCI